MSTGQVLYRNLNKKPALAVKAAGSYIYHDDGSKLLDAIGGAAVTSVGHSNQEVIKYVCDQLNDLQFAHTTYYTSKSAEKLASIILEKPIYQKIGLSRVGFYNSGSEANESALKMVRQVCVEKGEPQRVNIISRDRSYHGNTLGAMSMTGHKSRMKDYEPLFNKSIFHKVSTPFSFHNLEKGETEEEYCQRLIKDLDDKFQELGPDTVMAVFAETMSGSTLGCAIPPKGYLEGVKSVCEKYGAYLILDEVMCGSGRVGSFFTWESLTDESNLHKVVPHVSTFGKSIGSGILPLSGLVVHKDLIDVIEAGSGNYMSRQTYQAHPVSCAAGYATQKYIKDHNLYENVKKMGKLLEKRLNEELRDLKVVADIRGAGLFYAVELMKDKNSMTPFESDIKFGDKLMDTCFKNGLAVMGCHGTVDGIVGDHIMLAPSFDVDEETINEIVKILKDSIVELMNDY